MSTNHHPCPICAAPVRHWNRYPRAVCRSCHDQAGDAFGQKLSFFNTSMGGGFKAIFTESQAEYHSHTCYINGVKCRADEHRFGGIVIEVCDLDSADEASLADF